MPVEAAGVPVGVAVDGANRNDFEMARATRESIPVPRPEPRAEEPRGMCPDKGYDYSAVRERLAEFAFTAHIRARGEEAQALKTEAGYKARRWVVERAHSWLNRYRAVLIRWCKKPGNFLANLRFAFGMITYRAAG